MAQKLTTISHGYYQPYFYWMFPIVVAREEGEWRIRSKAIMGWSGAVLSRFAAHAPSAPR